jgi:hypothetical protein
MTTKVSNTKDNMKEDPGNPKITIGELYSKIANPKHSKESLAKYLILDEEKSGPFKLVVKPNPETVDVSGPVRNIVKDRQYQDLDREAQDLINAAFIFARSLVYLGKFIRERGYNGPKIVSEGDSWFLCPYQKDIIDYLTFDDGYDLAVSSLEAAGDTLETIVRSGQYMQAIPEQNASIFLFSGGGNDVLGGGRLKEYLRDYDPTLSPAEHLLPNFSTLLDHIMALYDQVLVNVRSLSDDVLIICHGYDRALPNNQRWLGKPMIERGIMDRGFQAAIIAEMIDQFNERLKLLTDSVLNASYLDLRGLVGPNRWVDEIHPTAAAFGDIAARFNGAIKAHGGF